MRRSALVYLSALICLVLTSCAGMVEHTLSDEFSLKQPATVAVLPVHGDGPERAKAILRKVAAQELANRNYRVKSLEQTDSAIKQVEHRRRLEPSQVAATLGTDALLLVEIITWDESLLTPYGAIEIEIGLTLYGKDGTLLWSATSREKHSNIKLDKELLKAGIIETYEPMLERLVASALITLPEAKVQQKSPTQKQDGGLFDWL